MAQKLPLTFQQFADKIRAIMQSYHESDTQIVVRIHFLDGESHLTYKRTMVIEPGYYVTYVDIHSSARSNRMEVPYSAIADVTYHGVLR